MICNTGMPIVSQINEMNPLISELSKKLDKLEIKFNIHIPNYPGTSPKLPNE